MVPEFVTRRSESTRLVDVGDGPAFLASVIDAILSRAPNTTTPHGGITTSDRVYLSYPRSFASLNYRIGTALSQIAFLPHIADVVQATIFLLLPTGSIGAANRKGRRGSPFAVADPLDVDRSLMDPLLPRMRAADQLRALAEAVSLIGMRSGSIVPFATLAIDSPWFAAHPALGYWWTADPDDLLVSASAPTLANSADDYMPPVISAADAERFVAAPSRSEVRQLRASRGTFMTAGTHDQPVVLANAFPDVVVDTQNTYTWSDVSLLRYFPDRAPRPAGIRRPEAASDDAPACTLVPALAAWRYFELGERVMWVDVGPSVPDDILIRTRRLAARWSPLLSEALRIATDPTRPALVDQAFNMIRTIADDADGPMAADLCFISEELWDFSVESAAVTALTGPLSVCVGAHGHDLETCANSLRYHLAKLEEAPTCLHLAGVSTHDTIPPPPEIGDALIALFRFLPGATSLVFSGAEWHAQAITNAEFGALPLGTPSPSEADLGLFNDMPIDWADPRLRPMQLPRADVLHRLASPNGIDTFDYRFTSWTDRCYGFRRSSPDGATTVTAVVNFEHRTLPLTGQRDDETWMLFGADDSSPDMAVIPRCSTAILVSRGCKPQESVDAPGIDMKALGWPADVSGAGIG